MAKKAKAAKPAKAKAAKGSNVRSFDRKKREPKTRAPKVPRIPRQPSLPTMEVPHNKEIETAGVSAHEAKIERMRLTEVETKRNDKLIAVMKKHGAKTYVNRIGSDVLTVELTVKDPELKVKTTLKPFDEQLAKKPRKARMPSDENPEAEQTSGIADLGGGEPGDFEGVVDEVFDGPDEDDQRGIE